MAAILTIITIISVLLFPTNGVLFSTKRNSCPRLLEYPISFINPRCSYNPNVLAELPSVLARFGYPLESHYLVNKAGYILNVFRIPPKNENAPAIYIQHGFMVNPLQFSDRKKSLAFALSDAGYDVWLGNARGTTYSKGHVTLSSFDEKFWDFSFDDVALEDLPPVLKHILKVTNQSGVIYVGHSMGSTLGLMFAAKKPTEASKMIHGMLFMSPVVYLTHAPVIAVLSRFSGILKLVLGFFGIKGLFKNEKLIHPTLVAVCKYLPVLCKLQNFMTYGIEPGQVDSKDWLLYYSILLTSTPVDQIIHYAQISLADEFQMFDYGKRINKKKYGVEKPPLYNLGHVTVPVVYFQGYNDLICIEEDVNRSFQELGSTYKKLIHIPKNGSMKFNHLDFAGAKDADKLLYPVILEEIETVLRLAKHKSKRDIQEPLSNNQVYLKNIGNVYGGGDKKGNQGHIMTNKMNDQVQEKANVKS